MTTSPSSKFSADYWAYLQANPEAEVAAIVRCTELSADCSAAAAQVGLQVSRELRLIRGLAVQGRADALVKLASEPWVIRVEPDQPVHTMNREVLS